MSRGGPVQRGSRDCHRHELRPCQARARRRRTGNGGSPAHCLIGGSWGPWELQARPSPSGCTGSAQLARARVGKRSLCRSVPAALTKRAPHLASQRITSMSATTAKRRRTTSDAWGRADSERLLLPGGTAPAVPSDGRRSQLLLLSRSLRRCRLRRRIRLGGTWFPRATAAVWCPDKVLRFPSERE